MIKIKCPTTSAAKKLKTKPAVITPQKIFTYGDLDSYISSIRIDFRAAKIQRNQRMAIYASNSIDYIILLFALWREGVVACPVSTRYPADLLAGRLKKINCRRIFVSKECQNIKLPPGVKKIDLEEFVHPCYCASKLPEDSFIRGENSAAVIFTSGSNGEPKAALLSFANFYYSAKGANENVSVGPNDRWLLSLPLYHVGGLGILFRVFWGGGAVVISKKAESIVQSVKRYRITHLSLVSTQLYRLLQNNACQALNKQLKVILLGGSMLPCNLISAAISKRLPIYTTYGLTEMASQVTTITNPKLLKKCVTSGKVLKYRKLKISKKSEILVKGEPLFKGYLKKGGLCRALTSDGWFKTGDLGKWAPNRHLIVYGRKDNMFISGGENIYPEEIEAVLCRLTAIERAVVVPVLSREFSCRPIAFIKPNRKQKITSHEISDYLACFLEQFKIPDVFCRWPSYLDRYDFKTVRQRLKTMAQKLSDKKIKSYGSF